MDIVLSVFPHAMVGKTTLEQFFTELDVNGDGKVSTDEFLQGMAKYADFSSHEVRVGATIQAKVTILSALRLSKTLDAHFAMKRTILSTLFRWCC